MAVHVQIAVVALMLVLFPCFGRATNYTVGDTDLWKLGTNYTTWASGKTFVVGDTLVFNYLSSAHNVLEVSKSAYDSCQATNPTQTHTGGSTNITLTTAGSKYFICGITGHCSGGMKLGITVAAANSSSPTAPSPAPSPASPTTPAAPSPAATTTPAAPSPATTTTPAAPSPATTTTPAAPSPATTTTPAATSPPTGSASGPNSAPNSAGHVTRIKDVAVLVAGSVLISVILI